MNDISWAVFDLGNETHVIPYINEGYVMPPHIKSKDCSCHPEIEEYEESDVVIHNMIH